MTLMRDALPWLSGPRSASAAEGLHITLAGNQAINDVIVTITPESACTRFFLAEQLFHVQNWNTNSRCKRLC